MENIKKILPEPEVNTLGAIKKLEWLSKDKFHGYDKSSDLDRFLIFKINELIEEVNELKSICKKGNWTGTL